MAWAVSQKLRRIRRNVIRNVYVLYSVVGYFTSNARRTVARTLPYLQSIIDERKAKLVEFGEDWPDKPVCG